MGQTVSTNRAGVGDRRAGMVGVLTMAAGAVIAVAALLSIAVDWAWFGLLIGFALLAYVVPQLHRFQAPADGWAGTWGSVLVAAGAAVIVALGVVFLIWEAVGDPGEPAWSAIVWMLGFFAFVVGVLLFDIGSIRAKVVPPAAPLVMLVGLVAAVAIDMATGAFFEDDGTTTEWGFYIGVPVFGLGLAWMGYAVSRAARPQRSTAA